MPVVILFENNQYLIKYVPKMLKNIKLDIDKKSVIYLSNYQNTYANDEELFEAFSEIGPITGFAVRTGFMNEKIGYIQFQHPEHALMATERARENAEGIKIGLLTGMGDSDVNLHVNNLPKTMGNEKLRSTFRQYGEIEQCSVKMVGPMKYGFVRFCNPDDAKQARAKLDGEMMDGNCVSVTFWQKREHRDAFYVALKEKLIRNSKSDSKNDESSESSYTSANQSMSSNDPSSEKSFSIDSENSFVSKDISITSSDTTPLIRKSVDREQSSFAFSTPSPQIVTKFNVEANSFTPKSPFTPENHSTGFNTPIPPLTNIKKEEISPFTPLSKNLPKINGPFIQDKTLLKQILVAKVEEEWKIYLDTIIKELMHRSTVELNTIVKNKDSLKDVVKEELRNIVFD